MGRHGHPAGPQGPRAWIRSLGAAGRAVRGFRPSRWTIIIGVLLVAAVALGVWWWTLQSVTDPVDANPVAAQAQVLSSDRCGEGGRTTVRLAAAGSTVTATLNGCGYHADQWLSVEYLHGHPREIRLAGTSLAGTRGLATRLVPIGILVAGAAAVAAAGALLVERRRARHGGSAEAVSVAHLRDRVRRAPMDRQTTGHGDRPGDGHEGRPGEGNGDGPDEVRGEEQAGTPGWSEVRTERDGAPRADPR